MGLDLSGLVDDQGAIPEAVLNALEAQNGARGNLGARTDAQRAPGTLSAQSGAIDLRETVMIGPDARLAMIEIEARGIPGRARTLPGMMIPPWMKMSPPKNSNALRGESSKHSPRKTRSGSPASGDGLARH